MILLLDQKDQIIDLSKCNEIPDYIKFVVDVEKQMIRIGGARHFEAEELFLSEGSVNTNLWGGGIDLISGQVDYGSMINIKPKINNSREIRSLDIIEKVDKIVKDYLSKSISLTFEEH